MKNSYSFRVMQLLILMIIICNLLSCSTLGDEFSSEKLSKTYREDETTSMWYEEYPYFEMPEDEFVELFTKSILRDVPSKPSIVKYKNNAYIVKEANGQKYRFTFENGLLTKFEIFGWEKIPFITAAYRDYTHLVRGSAILEERTKNRRGFYDAMPEEEFLKIFSNAILSHSKSRDGENHYVFIGKDEEKYQVTFSREGYLIGMGGVWSPF